MESSKEQLTTLIYIAFAGVRLEEGISSRQTQIIYKYGEDYTDEEFKKVSLGEITHDWHKVPANELEQILVSYLDSEGFRY